MNKQWLLKERPAGLPTAENWQWQESEMPQIADEEVLVKVLYISLDPAMRGWMNQARSYVPPVKIGAVMRAGAVGEVVESNSGQFKKGDYVSGLFGVQAFARGKAEDLTAIDANLAPLPRYLGALGMPGMTAYFGLFDVGALQPGETVLVSGAAGAVGSVVGQLAKAKDCQVVGIAGGQEKCDYLTNELGYDAAIDYKTENVGKMIKKHLRKGVDVYFDNVGGEILEAALFNIKRGARIVICGAISQYNTQDVTGPRNYLSLLVNRARMQGFVVFDYADRYQEGAKEIAALIDAGKIKAEEHIEEGLERFPEVFLQLFSGQKRGKLILKV